jgi:hypothetical protein
MIKKYPELHPLTKDVKPSKGLLNNILAYSKMVEVKKGKEHKVLIQLN